MEEPGSTGSREASDERIRRMSEQLEALERHKSREIELLSRLVRQYETEIARLKDQLNGIRRSIPWRILRAVARLTGAGAPSSSPRGRLHARARLVANRVLYGKRPVTALRTRSPGSEPVSDFDRQYAVWLVANEARSLDLEDMRTQVDGLAYTPTISVVVPVFDPEDSWLRLAIESVRDQIYPHWELCLADDASKAEHVASTLNEFASLDRRIKVVTLERNSGIAAASNGGLEIATGEFVAFLDHDDELAPHALFEVASKLNEDPTIDLIYSDEDKLSENGERVDPFFKPDWSPDLLRSFNYITHLCVIRRTLIDQVGRFHQGMDGAQDYDLILRCTEKASSIVHIPKMLYHWRISRRSASGSAAAKPYALAAGQHAIEAALERADRRGRVEVVGPFRYIARYEPHGQPLVSIIIPTRDNAALLKGCVDSICTKSMYGKYELVIIDNGSVEPRTTSYLAQLAREHRVESYPHKFNWSAINNFAVTRSSGEILLFLNDDIEVIDPGWLEDMIGHVQRSEVGAVGAKLLYPDGSIQHCGVVVGVGGVATHVFQSMPQGSAGYRGFIEAVRNYSAVTGACMMVRRDVFNAVGGFDEQLRVAFGDIDFCLRLREKGYSIVYTPGAVLFHKESASRGKLHPIADEQLMRKRWPDLIASGDPFYNPNLTRKTADFALRS